MHGYNYRFEINPVKNTIKLRPTAGTYAKAFAPVAVLWVAILGIGAYAQRQIEKDAANEMEDYLKQN